MSHSLADILMKQANARGRIEILNEFLRAATGVSRIHQASSVVRGQLQSHGLAPEFGRFFTAVHNETIRPVDFQRQLAKYCQILGVSLELNARPAPWRNWTARSVVRVVIGHRTMQHVKGNQATQEGISLADAESLRELVNTLSNAHGLAYRLEFDLVAPSLSKKNQEASWRKVMKPQKRSRPACVCVIGSSMTNSLNQIAARHILLRENPPAQFRWSVATAPDLLSGDICKDEQEGIWTNPQNGQTLRQLAARTNHAIVQQKLQEFKNSPGRPLGLSDCGMLLISHRRGEPIFIVAAGHGPHGTLSAMNGLDDPFAVISDQLNKSAWFFGVCKAPLTVRGKSQNSQLMIDPNWLDEREKQWEDWQIWTGEKWQRASS